MMIEEYKNIMDFEGLYQVSNFGNVYSLISDKILKPCFIKGSNSNNYGAYSVTLYKDKKASRKYIHILVCETFISPRPYGMQVRHLDSDTSNNKLDNLRWGTPKQNSDDQVKTGNRALGVNHGQSRLKESDVLSIRSAFSLLHGKVKRGWYLRQAELYGVSNKSIINITTRKTWAWL